MDGVAREDSWKDRTWERWAKFVHWLRPLVTTRADLLRHRLRLGRRPRLRPASVGCTSVKETDRLETATFTPAVEFAGTLPITLLLIEIVIG